jgi:UDP-4-amino-4,6-dideoxy-N-acetyl-beta-L-altrosamine N-acetyltransferase
VNFRGVSLRPINREDCEIIFRWRNAPQVREASFNSEEISYDNHCNWFERQLSGSGRTNLIFSLENVAAGVVYFEIDDMNGVADFGYYKDVYNFTQNIGLQMEIIALDYAFNILALRKLTCKVLSNNRRVIKFHKEFGFEIEGCQRQQIARDDSFLDVYFLALFLDRWVQRRPCLEWMI